MNPKPQGFSLIEVTLALAVLAVAVVVCLGVLSAGLSSSRQASEHLIIGLILEEAQNRLEGSPLREGAIAGSPFYYTVDGEEAAKDLESEKYFRLAITLAKPTESQLPQDASGLLAVNIVLAWPVDGTTGIPLGDDPETVHQTLLVGTHTGTDWTEVDPEFQPKIEL